MDLACLSGLTGGLVNQLVGVAALTRCGATGAGVAGWFSA